MITHTEYHAALQLIKQYEKQIIKEVSKTLKEANTHLQFNMMKFSGVTSETYFNDVRCTTHMRMVIHAYCSLPDIDSNITNETKVKDLSNISIKKFSAFRSVGKKTVQELIDLCNSANVTLSE